MPDIFKSMTSADWGDYISFATRMREKAEANGQDLLVVDSGDRIEGNGLYDASDPKGEYTFNIFKEQHIDVICAGNHELYKKNSSENEYLVTVPDFKDNYLASNLDIIDPHTGDLVPLAPRYKKFTTKKQGLKVLSFGFIFDFVGNYNNTVVQPVEQTIKEAWFQEAIRDREVDLFLVVGHVHIRAAEFDAIYKAISFSADTTTLETIRGLTQSLMASKVDASWKLLGFYPLMEFRRKVTKSHQHRQLRLSPGSTSTTIYSPSTAIPVLTQVTSTRIMVGTFRSRYNQRVRNSNLTKLTGALRKTFG
jgi:hypothetical protein